MGSTWNRRQTFRAIGGVGLAGGLAGWEGLAVLAKAGGREAQAGPEPVSLRAGVEPVVRWIEETPRDQVFEVAVRELKEGLSYRDLMAGLFLAGIRNIKPRPVGFKFHAVLVINSAHVLGQTGEDGDRLLPMFWALDNFKGSQEQDEKEGDWTLAAVDEPKVPRGPAARKALEEAFETWDSDAADVATAGLCQSAGAAETMEVFWRAAVRDQRNIGHKPIFAMQCWRTLQAIGWEHAEPVLRSLSFGLLDLQGDREAAPIGPFESNLARSTRFREDWTIGRADWSASKDLLDTIRQGTAEEASEATLRLSNDGVAPGLLWDAILLAGNELMVRQPGIIPLHAVTAANALHYIFRASGDATTRCLALLQAAGWVSAYRDRLGLKPEAIIDRIEPIRPKDEDVAETLAAIVDDLDSDRGRAMARAVGFLESGGDPRDLFRMARRRIFLKGRDSHDYKFGAAAFEEFELAGDDRWKMTLAAAILSKVPAASVSDSPLMKRAREAVAGV
jgi:hypothetical protein